MQEREITLGSAPTQDPQSRQNSRNPQNPRNRQYAQSSQYAQYSPNRQQPSNAQAQKRRHYTPAQRAEILRRRKKRRAERRRNQLIFLALCAVVLLFSIIAIVKAAMMAFAVLRAVEWPEINLPTIATSSASSSASDGASDGASDSASSGSAQSADDVDFGEASYDLSGYVYDEGDARMLLVNVNLQLDADYTVVTEVADDATGATLETEAAASYRAMASAAAADGITLVLTAGYHDADAQQAIFDEWQQYYIDDGYSEEEAYTLAQMIVAEPYASEHLTGYGADILSADYTSSDLGYADTAAFAWLERYAAEYGFILRYDEDKQMITGRTYEPWHWRYVGVENAKAMVESGMCLEEFIEAGGVW